MAIIPPVVRHMILCDDAQKAPSGKESVMGICAFIRSEGDPPYPHRHPLLCVYLLMTNGRGTGSVRILVRHATTERVVAGTPPRQLGFPSDPLHVHSLVLRILNCPFPEPGLYYVDFHVDGVAIASEPLLLR
jgi:hypothetical protein